MKKVYSLFCALCARFLVVTTLLLTLGVGNAWASDITIYVTGKVFIGTGDKAWDNSTSSIKVDVRYKGSEGNFNKDDAYMDATMTNTGYTYNGYPIYSYTWTPSYGGGQYRFKHYKGDDWQEDYTAAWSTENGKIYDGYYSEAHHWITYGRDITIYAIPEATEYSLSPAFDVSTHVLLANVKIGSTGDGEWLGIWPVFSKTDYKYNGKWIYKATVFAKYNVICRIEFHEKESVDGDTKSLYNYNPASEVSADDIDGKIFGGWVSEKHTWYNYATDIAFDQQSGSGGSSSVTATVGSSMPAATMPTRPGYTFGGYFSETNGGGDQYYNADGSSATDWIKDGPTTLYAQWTEKTMTFNAATDGNWNTASNWTDNVLPTIDHDVVITKPVTVDVTNARAKSVVIDQHSGNTGKLSINAGMELVIATTLRKTTDGSSYGPTAENDIFINSSPAAGLGALVMGSHDGTNQATVNFYSKSHGVSESEESVAQYVGTPFGNHPIMLYQFYNSWMYQIDGNDLTNIIWEQITGNTPLNPFQGYCVISADNEMNPGHMYWMLGTLVASEDQNIELIHRVNGGVAEFKPNNENLLANSWMAPIKINAFDAENDFTDTKATIYIFNSCSLDYWNKTGEEDEDKFNGNYSTYTVGTADDADVIPAMQAFSVFPYGTLGVANPSIKLDYEQLVYAPAVLGTVPAANKAPRRGRVKADEANKLRLFVRTANGYGDMLYMWEHEDFVEGFENGWDGDKLPGESVAPQLYAVTLDGNMAVNCVPDYEGVVIGFKAGDADNVYTLTFECDDAAEALYLYDTEAQEYTRVLNANSYVFTSSDKVAHNRFVLTRSIPQIVTGCENISAEAENVRKLFINGQLCIIRAGRMYDATGAVVR